jgi:transposase
LANFDDRDWGRQIRRMNLLSHLLPDRTRVRLETWNLDLVRSAITLTLQARRITACCPLCSRRSKRFHSRYERTLADLPWGAHAVTIWVRVRRLFCRNARCERCIFAERLPGIALPWARRCSIAATDLPPEKWTPGYAVFWSACCGVM